MHSHLKGVLDSFASHLKIRRHEGDVCEIAQKYLALGCNVVPTEHVYVAISSDYELLKLKTQNPPLAEYAHEKRAPIDATTFVEIVKNGFLSLPPKGAKKETTPLHEFANFVESVVLPPSSGGEDKEKWVEAWRKDKWKDVALFLTLNYKENPQFPTLLKSIVGEDEASAVRKRMLAYKPMDKKVLAHDLGKLIKSLAFSNEFVESVSSATPEGGEEETIKETLVPFVSTSLVFVDCLRQSTPEKDIVWTPVLDAYRKRAGLPATVDPKRIAKQMVGALLISPPKGGGDQQTKEVGDQPTFLLLRSQTKLEPLNSKEERAAAVEFIHSNLLSSEAINTALGQSTRAHLVAFACNQKKWDARTLLAHVMDPEGHMDERTLAKWEKMEKKIDDDKSFLENLFETK